MPELALDPAVVLGLSSRESRAHNSDHKETAMQRPIGPERTADANPDPSLVPAIRRRIRITRDEIARLEANVAADEAWLRSLTDDG